MTEHQETICCPECGSTCITNIWSLMAPANEDFDLSDYKTSDLTWEAYWCENCDIEWRTWN